MAPPGYWIEHSPKSAAMQMPAVRHERVRASVAPLDEHSFPSGHTLHAASFSVVAVCAYPALAWLVAPFTVLVLHPL